MIRMLFVLCALTSVRAYAEDLSIIDVRRNITLADDDTVYKDFYITADGGSGLKKNLVVTAMRKISIRDASGSQAYGEIQVPVGQLKIIAVYNKIAVAREYKLLSRDELPMLEQIGIMTGDKIDLQGSFVDISKPAVKPKRKVSENETPVAAAITVAAAIASPAAPVSASPGAPSPVTTTSSAPTPVTAAPAALTAAAKTPTPEAPKVTSAAVKGPAPASVPEKLEKSADSGDNTAL